MKIDYPREIETIQKSYGDLMLMKNPNEKYSIWFRKNGLHTGKKLFDSELSARQFLNEIMINGFSILDL